MNLIKTFVGRPVTTVMIVMVFVVLGVQSYSRMVVDLFPELDFPLVQIVCIYPGAGPDEIESQMIKKIEDEVSNISDIKTIQSEINESYGYIIVRFKLGVDIDVKALDVKDKVEGIKQDLPEDAEDPVIAKYDPLSMPVIKVAVLSDQHTPLELYEMADKDLKNYFSQASGVAKVEVLGGAKRQINVLVKLEKLAQYHMTLTDVVQHLGQENLDVPAGNVYKRDGEVGVRFKAEAKSIEEIENVTFYAPGHGVIRLKDIARIEDGSEQVKSFVRFLGKEAVLLDIYKRSDGNAIEVADGIDKRLEKAAEMVPPGVTLQKADDSSTFIRSAVKNATSNIFLGVIFCAIVLYVFLRDLRITVVASAVIPTSIISAFLLMDAFGFTMNMLSLAALGISIGTLVANAIVVLENITRHIEMGKDVKDAAVVGTSEIAVAVLAAAGTNIVVFTPIAFMGGIVGQFFYQFGLTVVFATIFSLVASFSLTPMLSSIFLRKKEEGEKPRLLVTRLLHAPLEVFQKGVDWIKEIYVASVEPALKHPWLTVLATIVISFLFLSLIRFVGGEFFPVSDEGVFNVKAQMPKGTSYSSALELVRKIETVIREEVPEAELLDYTAQAGGENVGFDEIAVKVRLVDMEKRDRDFEEIMYSLQEDLAKIPGAEIYTTGSEQGGPGTSDLDIEVRGPDYDKLAEISSQLREIMLETGNFRAVVNSYRIPKDEIHFIPNQYRKANYGLPNAYLGINMRYMIEGQKGAVLRVGGEEYEIVARLEESARDSETDLASYKVMSPSGAIPLSQLGEFKVTKGYSSIKRVDKERVILLYSYISNLTLNENQALLAENFKKVDFPPGYSYKFAGNAEEMQETFQNIMVAFILAVILTYMLLAAILNSFVHPITIGVTVLYGVVGVVLTLFFTGLTINVMSLMAVVMLVGIVVNNGILIIDYAIQRTRECDATLAHCVKEAADVRFRAILMTNLAIIAGIAPQIFGGSGTEYLVPIAAATMGGVAVSTIFTFYAVPALFVVMETITGSSGKVIGKVWGRLSKGTWEGPEKNDPKKDDTKKEE